MIIIDYNLPNHDIFTYLVPTLHIPGARVSGNLMGIFDYGIVNYSEVYLAVWLFSRYIAFYPVYRNG